MTSLTILRRERLLPNIHKGSAQVADFDDNLGAQRLPLKTFIGYDQIFFGQPLWRKYIGNGVIENYFFETATSTIF